MTRPSDSELQVQLNRIQEALAAGHVLQAEMSSLKLIERRPDCVPALTVVAQCASGREDHVRAALYWAKARSLAPGDGWLLHQEALSLANQGDLVRADALFSERWRTHASLMAESWLLWGQLKYRLDQPELALKAWFRAITQARRQGRWVNEATTPPAIRSMVLKATEQLAAGKREMLRSALQPIRREVGDAPLVRIDRAVANYLGIARDGPSDSRQRPKFLYIPGLPDAPYHDPHLQPWAGRLEEAFEDIREEAAELLADKRQFESFLTFGAGTKVSDYVAGDSEKPSWDAFFFYRHGQRFDANHERCPRTSELLESIDLCRIKGQAPEVCFSLLAPGSHIMPHYGVTNSRLVMHLPLKVPRDCALNIVGAGEHRWEEGRLMMFDDTYQHEAWNRSTEMRLILLMDCWNPHLRPEERLAITRLVERLSDFENVF
jgi:aspartate beta-hydroxylase